MTPLEQTFYYIIVAVVFGCIGTLLALALFYGRRARRNVKKEKVSRLPDGFSPLDVQRIFIGKTYPRRITRALIAWWAECGYIRVERVGMFTVKLYRIFRTVPKHDSEDAKFFDRGTYVRERDLLYELFGRNGSITVNLLRPMFPREKKEDDYAVREDVGVYTEKHYRLKVVAMILSIAPFAVVAVWQTAVSGIPVSAIMLGVGLIGLFVLRFMTDIPILFRLVWCSLWLGAPIAFVAMGSTAAVDPLHVSYAACVILMLGTLVLVRFVDHREKNNLAEYSDLINYRKFLLTCKADELGEDDYRAALPFIYAFRIKPLVARKFKKFDAPKWYKSGGKSGKGAML